MSFPETPIPSGKAHSTDLNDAEFAELDELLASTPEPLQPVDVVMLDGFLCGMIVQPVLRQPQEWLHHVFDFDGNALPADVDAAWLERTTSLVVRRYNALNRALVEDGWFNPLILEPDDEADGDAEAEPTAEADGDAEGGEPEAANPVSQALLPWAAGFLHANLTHPELTEMADDAVAISLARIYRHLPAETDDEREVVATLDREAPLASLDDAIEELVAAVADLDELTRDARYQVDTVRRDTPKAGRNDPCPCGSGKKYKVCHGAS